MFNYAQTDSNGICIAVSQVTKRINSANAIEVENYDFQLIGKKYNNGIWEEVEAVSPESQSTTTQQDRIEAGIDYLVMLSQ